MRQSLFSLIVALTISISAITSHAQSTLKMMIPANPGGGWDQTGRQLAAAMQSAKLVYSVKF
jgi:putative tricarboxylic transport membrane protein